MEPYVNVDRGYAVDTCIRKSLANPGGGHAVYVVDTEFGVSFREKIENSSYKSSGVISFLIKIFSGEESLVSFS